MQRGPTNTYGYKTRVGNWSEDWELQDARMHDFLRRKERGQLLVHQVQRHLNTCLQDVGLTFAKDGNVHYGDHVMIFSVQTEGVLAVDPQDVISASGMERKIACTSSTLVKGPVARNVFVIEPVDDRTKVGDPLCFGQQFRLRTNPKLSKEPSYLESQSVSTFCASKISRKQEVGFVGKRSHATIWTMELADIGQRFEVYSQPIPANSKVVIVHKQTRKCLSTDKVVYVNDFGNEFEVCGHTHTSIGKSQGLYAEQRGLTTGDVASRPEGPQNHWAVLTAASEDMEQLLHEEEKRGGPRILIAGAPASGKGTQCALIKEKYGVVHISTGDILRAEVKAGSDLGQEAKHYMDKGNLVPDDLIISMVQARLEQDDCKQKGWLLDGFPRTEAQADALAAAGIKPDVFILLDVPDAELIGRVVGRRLDPETGEIYHVKFKPPPSGAIATRVIQRSDDTEDKARVRLTQYHKHIGAVSKFYNDIMQPVDGNQRPSDVFKCVEKVLG